LGLQRIHSFNLNLIGVLEVDGLELFFLEVFLLVFCLLEVHDDFINNLLECKPDLNFLIGLLSSGLIDPGFEPIELGDDNGIVIMDKIVLKVLYLILIEHKLIVAL